MTLTRATSWSVMYVVAAFIFAGYIWSHRGPEDAQLFLAAYMLEKVLSVDNLMVFAAIFSYFGIRPQCRHRILRWGIVGAAAMRLAFVCLGTELFAASEKWMGIIFAGLIAYAGYTILNNEPGKEVDHASRWYVRWLQKWRPVYTGPGSDEHFLMRSIALPPARSVWEREHGPGVYWCITPALLCLVAIEVSDVVFAVDSVPVVIAVARDPFIVYSAMIFAILGLRAMYFVLDALQHTLSYMNLAVAMVLFFVACKLLVASFLDIHVPPLWSLGAVLATLGAGVLASIGRKETA
jgi:tellurite resistance protein TerC